MPEQASDLRHTLFVKTSLGQQEISSRSLGLPPLTRRMLILVDGKRSFQELEPMTGGQDLSGLLQQLIDKGCIEACAVLAVPVVAPTPISSAQAQPRALDMQSLPEPAMRSAKEVDMARNFMSNTVNMEFGMNMRLSLIESIANCSSSAELRQIYPDWYNTMNSSKGGAKELPKLIEKLFRVL
jgi:hypothetical protein